MAGGVRIYSETFINTPSMGWTYYTVPSGHRAVLMTACVTVGASTGGYVDVYVNGNVAFFFPFQEPGSAQKVNLRLVAYGGQQLAVHQYQGASWTILSGYLFEDAGEELGAAMQVQSWDVEIEPMGHNGVYEP